MMGTFPCGNSQDNMRSVIVKRPTTPWYLQKGRYVLVGALEPGCQALEAIAPRPGDSRKGRFEGNQYIHLLHPRHRVRGIISQFLPSRTNHFYDVIWYVVATAQIGEQRPTLIPNFWGAVYSAAEIEMDEDQRPDSLLEDYLKRGGK